MATPKRARATRESTSRNNKKTAPATTEASAVQQQTTSPADTEQAIRTRAYEIWEQRGRTNGNAVEDWLRAEAEVSGRNSART